MLIDRQITIVCGITMRYLIYILIVFILSCCLSTSKYRGGYGEEKSIIVYHQNEYLIKDKVIEIKSVFVTLYFSHDDFINYQCGKKFKSEITKNDYDSINSMALDTIPHDIAIKNGNFYRFSSKKTIGKLIEKGKLNIIDNQTKERVTLITHGYRKIPESTDGCGHGWAYYYEGQIFWSWRYKTCPF
ncbi:MAG: hypothetical protein ACLGGV_01705 [Bacteroidia bacterium]